MSQLCDTLRGLAVDEPAEAGGLQAFGLRWQAGPGPDYLTLDDALAAGLLEVTEVGEAGAVPSLKVRSKGDRLTFLMAGEHLAGGKQNRVLNASLLVPAGAELPIPVSCVERGRWAYRSAAFGSSGTASHGKLRKMMHDQTTRSLKASGTPRAEQGEVWREVDRVLGACGSASPTAHLDQAYADTAPALRGTVDGLAAPEGASGVAFAYGGRIVGLDLFDRPETLRKLWAKLVRAYALDAWTEAAAARAVTADEVRAWLAAAPAAKEEVFKSPGAGDDVRLESAALVGAGLVLDGHAVHVEVFAGGPAA